MQLHMQDAQNAVTRMKGRVQGRLILDADSLRSPRTAMVRKSKDWVTIFLWAAAARLKLNCDSFILQTQ